MFSKDKRVHCYLTDVRETDKLASHFEGVDYALHTAAYKHVTALRKVDRTRGRRNVGGAQSVVKAACSANVKKVLFTSSDKAVNPTNVMGATKLLGERIFTSSQLNRHRFRHEVRKHAFRQCRRVERLCRAAVPAADRAGRASHAPTDPEMTRFMMSTSQATSLVLESLDHISSGEVFVDQDAGVLH